MMLVALVVYPLRVAPETVALLRKTAKENRLWGAERIRGELLRLGIRVSKRTIQKYMPKVRRKSSQTWVAIGALAETRTTAEPAHSGHR